MAAQFDFIPGLDISSLASTTQAQLLQMVSQLAPLPNVGGIIYGAVAPDVVNNARFSRYAWIDTSGGAPYVLKTYNGAAWVASTVGAGSISAAAQITDGIITLAKLSVAGGGVGKLIRVNAGNTAFEFINFSDLLSAGSVSFTAIETTGKAANYFLKQNNANTALNYEPFSAAFIPVNSIGFTQLQNGAAAVNILKSNGAANAWQEIEHKLSNMTPTGGTAYQVARVNAGATALEYATPQVLQVVHTEIQSTVSCATVIPFDGTIPQYTEGDDIGTNVAITPLLATSFLLIEAVIQVAASAALQAIAAIFKDASAINNNSIAAGYATVELADYGATLYIRHRVASTNTTARTYSLRVGPNGAGTIYVNRNNTTAALFGGVCCSSLRVTEMVA